MLDSSYSPHGVHCQQWPRKFVNNDGNIGGIPGCDAAGEVVELGPGEVNWKVGDRVMAVSSPRWTHGPQTVRPHSTFPPWVTKLIIIYNPARVPPHNAGWGPPRYTYPIPSHPIHWDRILSLPPFLRRGRNHFVFGRHSFSLAF